MSKEDKADHGHRWREWPEVRNLEALTYLGKFLNALRGVDGKGHEHRIGPSAYDNVLDALERGFPLLEVVDIKDAPMLERDDVLALLDSFRAAFANEDKARARQKFAEESRRAAGKAYLDSLSRHEVLRAVSSGTRREMASKIKKAAASPNWGMRP